MKQYGPFALRIGVGGIFVVAGTMKLLDPSMVVGMLGGLGFPAPGLWTWLLILTELLGGAAVLTGFHLKYSTAPLMVVLIVAIVVTAMGGQAMMALKDVVILSGLVSLYLSGSGTLALSKD
ncbi:DoxX family protein [Candidatus Woesearchaeota archaeon]|nr:DoxX family protein [Candidatus Woesearchaeota archaeon]